MFGTARPLCVQTRCWTKSALLNIYSNQRIGCGAQLQFRWCLAFIFFTTLLRLTDSVLDLEKDHFKRSALNKCHQTASLLHVSSVKKMSLIGFLCDFDKKVDKCTTKPNTIECSWKWHIRMRLLAQWRLQITCCGSRQRNYKEAHRWRWMVTGGWDSCHGNINEKVQISILN